jgi:hypothetical protein
LGPDEIADWPRIGRCHTGPAAERRRWEDKPLSGQRDTGPRVITIEVAVLPCQAVTRPGCLGPHDSRLRRLGGIRGGPGDDRAKQDDGEAPHHKSHQRQPSTGMGDEVGPADGASGSCETPDDKECARRNPHGLYDRYAPESWSPRTWGHSPANGGHLHDSRQVIIREISVTTPKSFHRREQPLYGDRSLSLVPVGSSARLPCK